MPGQATSQPNRWSVALAGVIIQIALGAVYAWSVFRIPLTKAFRWTISQVRLTFTIANLHAWLPRFRWRLVDAAFWPAQLRA